VYTSGVSEAADLGILEAAELLGRRARSSRELVAACLTRIAERDGRHSFDGDPESVNAWVRVYEEDALAAAWRADERRASGEGSLLTGIPVGLKDLYAVAGKPLTGSSRVLDETPSRSCDAWARLEAEGMVLLGQVHTHELAAGGTTDQVGNPWALDRSPGGSSGGSAAALAASMTPAATGTDTAGSLRIPSAYCATSAVKPTRGLVPMRGIVPLAPTLDHAGPMARTVADCEPLLAALAGVRPPGARRPLRRVAVSPRIAQLEATLPPASSERSRS
jgi:aspartyl-tRNA(Asn)/glutamyl-tRNA(Gln) amidotransferase subunit A